MECEAAKVGLHLNAKKTELMAYKHDTPINITTRCGDSIKVVENFKYLGAWMKSSEKDFKVQKALVWRSVDTFAHDKSKIVHCTDARLEH